MKIRNWKKYFVSRRQRRGSRVPVKRARQLSFSAVFTPGNAAFKATCYSVVCQPIYIGLDSAFTSQATGTRPEEHRDSHDRNVINLWPRLIFAKSVALAAYRSLPLAAAYLALLHAPFFALCNSSRLTELRALDHSTYCLSGDQLLHARSFQARETSRPCNARVQPLRTPSTKNPSRF